VTIPITFRSQFVKPYKCDTHMVLVRVRVRPVSVVRLRLRVRSQGRFEVRETSLTGSDNLGFGGVDGAQSQQSTSGGRRTDFDDDSV